MRNQPITVHRAGQETGGYDDYGEPVFSAPRDTDVVAWRVSPVSAVELIDGRQTLVTGASGVLPPGTDIRATDELTANGRRYRVTGVMSVPDARDPTKEHHVRVTLEEAS